MIKQKLIWPGKNVKKLAEHSILSAMHMAYQVRVAEAVQNDFIALHFLTGPTVICQGCQTSAVTIFGHDILILWMEEILHHQKLGCLLETLEIMG